MKYAFIFILFGFVCAFYTVTSSYHLFFRFIAGSSAVAFWGIGLAYAFLGPRALLKKSDGRLSLASYILYWPYHLLNSTSLYGFRRGGKENAFDRIDHNVFLGCRLGKYDEEVIKNSGIKSVLDLTCEFGESQSLRQLSYRCIPLLDTYAPTLEQLESGTEWIKQQAANGPVYVHCALGHGRSATFVAAYLMAAGKASNAKEAVNTIKLIRPKIGLSAQQTELLSKFETRFCKNERSCQ